MRYVASGSAGLENRAGFKRLGTEENALVSAAIADGDDVMPRAIKERTF